MFVACQDIFCTFSEIFFLTGYSIYVIIYKGDIMTIGERIKKARETKGISQTELANAVKISKQNLYKYENNIITNIPSDKIEAIAYYLEVSPAFLMGWEDEKTDNNTIDDKINSAFNVLDNKYLRQIPVYESVSAGFGAYADNTILEYMPLYIRCDYEAENTLCIKVVGDSMYPKIEDGDIIQVEKQESVDSGQIAVVLLDGDEGFVKKVIYGADWIELHSFNPEYKTMKFIGPEVQRIRVVGLVKKVIKNFA